MNSRLPFEFPAKPVDLYHAWSEAGTVCCVSFKMKTFLPEQNLVTDQTIDEHEKTYLYTTLCRRS